MAKMIRVIYKGPNWPIACAIVGNSASSVGGGQPCEG